MPGSIFPLPVMLEEQNLPAPDAFVPPKTVVVRYGYLRHIAEVASDVDVRIGCGTQLVARTPRGIELVSMVTTTCANGGCSNAVTRKQMLAFIDRSGGRDYPFTTNGKVLRIATPDDLNDQQRLDEQRPEMLRFARAVVEELDLNMKLVQVEHLLGGERVIFHYTAEHWVDFRELVRRLAGEYHTRIEMHQVSARDEARITADYEKCGQHCCCKQFLKVLKPVSMRNAKIQKATLDPTKISGRCGRLMCCLRYEEETYDSLRKRLPNRQTRVRTPEGEGVVLDTQILTQLALVMVEGKDAPAAYPIENLTPLTKEEAAAFNARMAQREREAAEREEARQQRMERRHAPPPPRSAPPPAVDRPTPGSFPGSSPGAAAGVDGVNESDASEDGPTEDSGADAASEAPPGAAPGASAPPGQGRRRRRRRRRGRGPGAGPGSAPGPTPPAP